MFDRKRGEMDTRKTFGTGSNNGIGEARLELTANGGVLFSGTLARLALESRAGAGTLAFTYRDPFDPEAPDAPRPLRAAVLRIEDRGEWPEPPASGPCRVMETRTCPPAGTCPLAAPCARFESDDPAPWTS